MLKNEVVRERLRLKYVTTGEWAVMDDEDRQDAVLLEMMLYSQMQPDYKVYSVAETQSYLTNLI